MPIGIRFCCCIIRADLFPVADDDDVVRINLVLLMPALCADGKEVVTLRPPTITVLVLLVLLRGKMYTLLIAVVVVVAVATIVVIYYFLQMLIN